MYAALSDFYLLMSRAFLAPREEAFAAAFRNDLGADLEAIAEEVSPRLTAEARAFVAAVASVPDQLDLLRGYSHLFLVPPLRAPLNAGLYLDGGVMGPSVDAMRLAYRHFGLDFPDGAGELPDFLPVLFEFTAILFDRVAREEAAGETTEATLADALGFRDTFLRPCLPALHKRIGKALAHEDDVASRATLLPYWHLADMAAKVAWEGEVPADAEDEASETNAPVLTGEAQTCRVCNVAYSQTVDIRNMKRILAKRGLDSDFLDVCPDCRTTEMGLVAVMPPEIRRHQWGAEQG